MNPMTMWSKSGQKSGSLRQNNWCYGSNKRAVGPWRREAPQSAIFQFPISNVDLFTALHCCCSTSVTCSDFISLKTASGRWWMLLLWSMRSSTFFSPARDLSWSPLMLLNLQEQRNHSHVNKSTVTFIYVTSAHKNITPSLFDVCVRAGQEEW